MKKLVVKPIGGLANRLLALDATIKLRNHILPKETIIIWEQNQNLNCAFNKLFIYPEKIQFLETKGFNKYSIRSYFSFYNAFNPENFKWPLLNKILGKEKKFAKVYYIEDMENLIGEGEKFEPELNFDSIYIAYYDCYFSTSKRIYHFKPILEIQQKIDDVVTSFDSSTVGVHIRRSDHEEAIRYSPIDGFIDKMISMLEDGVESFFLATDSLEVENEIKSHFGTRIISRKKSFNRNSPDGGQDALIDLYCLSNTKSIIGSYNSTFSQVAAEIGGIENYTIFIDKK